MRTLPILLALLWYGLSANAQVILDLNVQGARNGVPVHATVFSDQDKKNVALENGRGEIPLLKFTQYIIGIYQRGSRPGFYTLDTENIQGKIKLTVKVNAGRPAEPDWAPKQHNNGSGWKKFDLDNVQDKEGFGVHMCEAKADVELFLNKGVKPRIDPKRNQATDSKVMEKREHLLGQEVYKLLGKKRALELELQRLGTNGFVTNSSNASANAAMQMCVASRKLLEREFQYAKVSLSLAQKEVDKLVLGINRNLKRGNTFNASGLRKAREKLNIARKEQEIAELNLSNKQTECWELKLNSEIDRAGSENEKALKRLELEKVRLYKRKDNAIRLYNLHTDKAKIKTGRERVVELANAQKYAAEQAKAKYEIIRNQIDYWTTRSNGSGQYQITIKALREKLVKREDLAYQAEMGYLEHLWYLRNKDEFKVDLADDLYARQSQLLPFEPIHRKTPSKDSSIVDTNTPDPNVTTDEAEANRLFNSFVKVKEMEDGNKGNGVRVECDGHYYEIWVSPKGKKSYFKNGKPITGLTYRFETVAAFGEFLENYKYEPQKERFFKNWFKRRTDY